MVRPEIERVWLRWLGGRPDRAGLGIATISFLVAVFGALLAFSAADRNTLYWVGYAFVALVTLGGWAGILYHRVLMQRSAFSRRDEREVAP